MNGSAGALFFNHSTILKTGSTGVGLTGFAPPSPPYNWSSVDLGMSSDDKWEFQDSSLQLERVEFVQHDAWSEFTARQVRVEVEVKEQHDRQDRWVDSLKYHNLDCGAWTQGEVTLFDDQEPTLNPSSQQRRS